MELFTSDFAKRVTIDRQTLASSYVLLPPSSKARSTFASNSKLDRYNRRKSASFSFVDCDKKRKSRLLPVVGRLRLSSLSNRSIQIPSDSTRTHTSLYTKTTSTDPCKGIKSRRPSLNSRLPRHRLDNREQDHSTLYSLDEFDEQFLQLYNEHLSLSSCETLVPKSMQLIIDYFENCIFSHLSELKLTNVYDLFPPIYAPWYEQTVCEICFASYSDCDNRIVICEGCDLSVHQICYGIGTIPSGDWLCKSCQCDLCKPTCYLCGNDQTGAFTLMKNKESIWVHNLCALWIPEVVFDDLEHNSSVRVLGGGSRRLQNTCYICKQAKIGLCIDCSVEGCRNKFHVTCAFSALHVMLCYMDKDSNVVRQSYCNDHLYAGYTAKLKNKDFHTQFPPNLSLIDLSSLHETFVRWSNDSICFDRASLLFDVDVSQIEVLYDYWMLKKRHHHFYFLKPMYFFENCKELSGEANAWYRRKLSVRDERFELEKIRNMSYLLLKRERLKHKTLRHEILLAYQFASKPPLTKLQTQKRRRRTSTTNEDHNRDDSSIGNGTSSQNLNVDEQGVDCLSPIEEPKSKLSKMCRKIGNDDVETCELSKMRNIATNRSCHSYEGSRSVESSIVSQSLHKPELSVLQNANQTSSRLDHANFSTSPQKTYSNENLEEEASGTESKTSLALSKKTKLPNTNHQSTRLHRPRHNSTPPNLHLSTSLSNTRRSTSFQKVTSLFKQDIGYILSRKNLTDLSYLDHINNNRRRPKLNHTLNNV